MTSYSIATHPESTLATTGAVPDEPLIDMRALAAWLAVSESTVRKWTAKGPGTGLVPTFIRVNGQIRFRPSDVRDFLVAKQVQ